VIRVDQYQRIRQLYVVEGFSQRQIARMLGISRNTVQRYCKGDNLPGERKPVKRAPSVITAEVTQFIKQCLKEDELERANQRHTARRIYTRLCEEHGFTGGESTVRQAVRELREKMPKVFVPLSFGPGEAAQVDWGEATVIINGQRVRAHLFCIRLCYSLAPFVIAYPTEREEAFLDGHRRAFEFFGGVPKDLIYDNLKTAVKDGWGKMAREQENFKVFTAHYAYHSRFCNPREGHEKGLVEDLVGYCRRNFLVPVPRVGSWQELNQHLAERCLRYIDQHHVKGKDLPVKDAYGIERKTLIPLPVRPYEAVKIKEARVDAFATVGYETNRYSVPISYAGKIVTLRISPFIIDIYYKGDLIASHNRTYQKHKTLYRLEHYLPLIAMRPRSVFNAKPVKEAALPEEIEAYARRLKDPERGMVRLLTLVIEHGVSPVIDALREARKNNQFSVDIVQYYLTRGHSGLELSISGPQVKAVDLVAYDALLMGGISS